jgi:uncharacterized Zn finger protein
VRRFGATWWAERWILALERLGGDYGARLHRGRIYARQGRVHDLTVVDGVVRARVTGSRSEPYEVTIRLAPLAEPIWARATRAMAKKAVFAARLLAGEMPRQIDEPFRAAGGSLFPERQPDLVTACSCPDWANPCKHVAAVHYVLGEFLDRDPFLLFELRGRPKDAVLAALRQQHAGSGGRGDGARGPGAEGARPPRAAPRAVPPPRLAADQYDALRGSVDGLQFRIAAPAVEGALLRQLGPPPSWRIRSTPQELLHPPVARAAALARELALGGSGEE